MDESFLASLLAIVLLVLANGFFALSEFSIIASRKSKLRRDVEEGKPGAKAAEKLYAHPEKFLASIQIGITLFGTLAGVFGGITLVDRLEQYLAGLPVDLIAGAAGPIAVTTVALMITIYAVVFGELVPKYMALSQPENYARLVSRPITLFIAMSSFFSSSLSAVSNLVVRILGIKTGEDRAVVTEDEINLMILEGREKGVFDPVEERLIKSVFDFADSTVRRAMTPRTRVIGLEINADEKEIANTITGHGFSRFPIYAKTIDNIVGVLYTKDVIVQRIDPRLIILKDLCRKAMFVPDSMPLPKLLSAFQKKKNHLAIVLDEFGGTAGIITLEDILEELVGEIQDEYDSESVPLVRHSDSIVYADGIVWPGAVNELLNSDLPEEQNNTLAGLFMDTLGRMPEREESIIIGGLKISVLRKDKNRLTRLKLEKIVDPKEKN